MNRIHLQTYLKKYPWKRKCMNCVYMKRSTSLIYCDYAIMSGNTCIDKFGNDIRGDFHNKGCLCYNEI